MVLGISKVLFIRFCPCIVTCLRQAILSLINSIKKTIMIVSSYRLGYRNIFWISMVDVCSSFLKSLTEFKYLKRLTRTNFWANEKAQMAFEEVFWEDEEFQKAIGLVKQNAINPFLNLLDVSDQSNFDFINEMYVQYVNKDTLPKIADITDKHLRTLAGLRQYPKDRKKRNHEQMTEDENQRTNTVNSGTNRRKIPHIEPALGPIEKKAKAKNDKYIERNTICIEQLLKVGAVRPIDIYVDDIQQALLECGRLQLLEKDVVDYGLKRIDSFAPCQLRSYAFLSNELPKKGSKKLDLFAGIFKIFYDNRPLGH